jgi:CBS domain-containing protein
MSEQIIQEEEAIAEERARQLARLGTDLSTYPIRSLPTLKPAVCVSPQDSLREAIDQMNEHGVGCVMAEENGRVVGVFTERDVLLKVVEQGVNLDATRVAEVMTPDPECLTPDDVIAYALNKMSVGGFRHVPLVDTEGRPAGIVSMRDVVTYIAGLFPEEVLNLPPAPKLGTTRQREGA